MSDILIRLDHEPSYCLQSDEKQLRRDAAAEIRELRNQVRELNALLLRQASNKMSRRAVA